MDRKPGLAGDQPKTLGRRPDSLGKRDLSEHRRHAEALCGDRPAARGLTALCDAMASFLPARPRETTVSAQINGSQPLSRRMLNALHGAFGLDDAKLSSSIWLELSPIAFRAAVEEARFGDPLSLLHRLADATDRVSIAPLAASLGIGALQRDERPCVSIGDSVRLRVALPFAGRVVVANLDRDGAALVWSGLDRWFGTVDQLFPAGSLLLPERGSGVPVGGPVGRSSLVVVMVGAGETLTPLPEASDGGGVDRDRVRRFVRDVAALPAAARRVAVIDYDVLRR